MLVVGLFCLRATSRLLDLISKISRTQKVWLSRDSLVLGKQNVNRILGIIKQLIKTLNIYGECFALWWHKFPGSRTKKLYVTIFNGPQMRPLTNDSNYMKSMNELKKKTWKSFILVIQNFLRNQKSQNIYTFNIDHVV